MTVQHEFDFGKEADRTDLVNLLQNHGIGGLKVTVDDGDEVSLFPVRDKDRKPPPGGHIGPRGGDKIPGPTGGSTLGGHEPPVCTEEVKTFEACRIVQLDAHNGRIGILRGERFTARISIHGDQSGRELMDLLQPHARVQADLRIMVETYRLTTKNGERTKHQYSIDYDQLFRAYGGRGPRRGPSQ